MELYDAIIVGSGPAGLAAAVNLSIREKRLLLFGTENLSTKLESAPKIDNYLGLPDISGKELCQRYRKHIEYMGITVINEQISSISNIGGCFSLATGYAIHESTAVILATGAAPTSILPGEERLLGRGVAYCATCDAPLYRGKTVAVLGFNGEAVLEAEFVTKFAQTVYYVPMIKTDKLPGEGVIPINEPVLEIIGEQKVEAIKTAGRTIAVDGVFVLRECIAPASLLPGISVENGFITVDSKMRTNMPGCYAAGDCTGKPHQIMRAVGQGQIAALSAAAYIDDHRPF